MFFNFGHFLVTLFYKTGSYLKKTSVNTQRKMQHQRKRKEQLMITTL